MRRLSEVDRQFADWLVIGQLDLEDLILEKFKTATDWENALKTVKTKGRDVSSLPSEVRIDCILVNTSSAKAAVEELIGRLFQILSETLETDIKAQLHAINNSFLAEAIAELSSRPQSIDEVAKANQKHAEFGRRSKEIEKIFVELEEKHTLLRSVAGKQIETMGTTMAEWSKFTQMLENHQEMIKEQVATRGIPRDSFLSRWKCLEGM